MAKKGNKSMFEKAIDTLQDIVEDSVEDTEALAERTQKAFEKNNKNKK